MLDPDEWSRQQKEQAEAQNSLLKKEHMEEALENEDSEMSAEEKHDKHLLAIRLKKDTEKKEDP